MSKRDLALIIMAILLVFGIIGAVVMISGGETPLGSSSNVQTAAAKQGGGGNLGGFQMAKPPEIDPDEYRSDIQELLSRCSGYIEPPTKGNWKHVSRIEAKPGMTQWYLTVVFKPSIREIDNAFAIERDLRQQINQTANQQGLPQKTYQLRFEYPRKKGMRY